MILTEQQPIKNTGQPIQNTGQTLLITQGHVSCVQLEFAPEPWSSRGSDLSKDLVVRFANASTGDSVDLLLQFMFAMPELLWMKDMCENLPLHGLCSNQLLDQDTKTRAACVMGR